MSGFPMQMRRLRRDCLAAVFALAAVWPAAGSATGVEVTGHVTTFNADHSFTHPEMPLEDYGFTVHPYITADLDTRLADLAADIRRSRLFYFGQQCNPAVVLGRPEAAAALRDLLRGGGTIVFDYCGIERPETMAFLESVGVAVPGGYAGGFADVHPSPLPAEAAHPLLHAPFELGPGPIRKGCYGHWATWSANQVAPFRATANDRAALILQAGVEGRGAVVFSRMSGMFRKDYGRRGEPVKNLLSLVFGVPVREKTVVPVQRRFVGTERLTVWHKPRYAPFPAEADAAASRRLSALRVRAAVNERISTAFLLTASAAGPLEVAITVNDLAGPSRLTAERILVRELQVLHDYTDRWLPDPMPEVRSLAIPAGETRQVWLTIDTTGVAPGAYAGSVGLSAAGLEPVDLPLELEVLPIELPTENPLRLCTWDYVPSIGRDKLIGGVQNWVHYHRDLVEHGTNVFPIMSFNHPRPVVDDDGNLTRPLDFTRFDTEFFTRDPGQMYLIMTPRVFGDLVSRLGAGSPAYERMLRAWLREVVRHVREDLGLGSGQFAFYPFDELHREEEIPLAKREYEIIEEVDPEARIFLTLGYQSIVKFDRVKVVAPHVDIWNVAIDFHRHWEGFRRQQREAIFDFCRRHGGEVWGYENVGRDDEWTAHRLYRLKPWGTWRLGLGGYGFWAYNVWKDDPWQVRDAAGEPKAGAGTERLSAVYSGPAPVSSVRWEALREGMNDVKYLAVLRREIEAARAAGRADDPRVRTAESLAEKAVKTVTEAGFQPELADEYRGRVADMILELRRSP